MKIENEMIFTDIDMRSTDDDLGGKANNLHTLSAAGLPVPTWCCVKEALFHQVIQNICNAHTDDNIDLAQLSDQQLAMLSDRLIEAEVIEIISQAITPYLQRHHIHHYAVRSSASMEDSGALSFAGLFDTYLFVPASEVAVKIAHCWQSVFSLNVQAYMKQHELDLNDLGMSVVLQEMIDSEKSGVLFQANPAGPLEEQVIVAGYGLGEGIVSDQVETDSYYCNRETGELRKQLTSKHTYFRRSTGLTGGLVKDKLDSTQQTKSVLSEPQISELLALSKKLSKIYPDYQDIEWAFDAEGALYLLQSRPITTLAKGTLSLYDNSNITESYPGMVLPLTESVIKKIYHKLFYHAFSENGGIPALLDRHQTDFSSMLECIEGRMYYNLSSWYRVMGLLPFSSRIFIPALEDAIGCQRSQVSNNDSWLRRLQKVRFAAALLHRHIFMGRLVRRHDKDFKALYDQTQEDLERSASIKELIHIYRSFFAKIFKIDQLGRVSDTYLTVYLSVLTNYLIRLGLDRDKAATLINGLLTGVADIESVKPVKSIKLMARLASEDKRIEKIIRTADNWQALLLKLAPYPNFKQCLLRHIHLYGDRTIGELKLETVTFRQQPLMLIKVIENYINHVADFSQQALREQELKRQAEDSLDALLKGNKIARRLAPFLLNKLTYYIKNREKFRLNRSRYYGVFRDIFHRIAKTWTQNKLLQRPDDIFYLTDTEVFTYAERNPVDIDALQLIIEQRKRQWKHYKNKKPTSRMWLKGLASENFIPQQDQTDEETQPSDGLSGVGCCPGIIEAEAIVLSEPDPTVDIYGKILVAENTDPGWVFLIMGAKALVVEKGSLLSHTAIIGRELGIPTVVGVKNATHKITTGMHIVVDGGSGTVTLTEKEETNNHAENLCGLS
ncbi:MAG: hypothetical protein K6L81_11480 [Agarilytica sp.]